jgi:hypothetical protein
MKIILCILTASVGLVLLMALIGALLPRTHQATRTAIFNRTPSEVYAAISDFSAMPSWRSSLLGVEILPPRDGHACYREVSRHQPITYIVLEDNGPKTLVTQIADENLPFSGTWTYMISPELNGSRVRIREQGEIRNLFFRFLARFVFGYTGTMEAYLRDLGRKFGETVTPVP